MHSYRHFFIASEAFAQKLGERAVRLENTECRITLITYPQYLSPRLPIPLHVVAVILVCNDNRRVPMHKRTRNTISLTHLPKPTVRWILMASQSGAKLFQSSARAEETEASGKNRAPRRKNSEQRVRIG